ncbi:uncharacterized protein LOC115627584 [Scaptodrosophila lebanonensis]|uniref:Uncharacterized protein LOC115627584 n=1 Tax=Drosophila lebanonensis TaxID=7225 RepID=A0A6J2TVI4_DROLE|nr:uncharacterized protein LOC115627584 [Scaptodrosophila lebanonensis]
MRCLGLALLGSNAWIVWTVWLIVLCSSAGWCYLNLEIGDPCTTSYRSNCQPIELCSTLKEYIRNGNLTPQTVQTCGYTIRSEKICCPLPQQKNRADTEVTKIPITTTIAPTVLPRTQTSSTTASPVIGRPDWFNIFNTSFDYVNGVERAQSSTRPPRQPAPAPAPTSVPSGPALQTGSPGFLFPGPSSLQLGGPCYAPLYEGICVAISKCESVVQLIDENRLRSDDVPSCQRGTYEEIICCPPLIPIKPRDHFTPSVSSSQAPPLTTLLGIPPRVSDSELTGSTSGFYPQTVQKPSSARALLSHYTHLASLAYANAAYDDFVHRCTAVVLTPQLLLTAVNCAPQTTKRPNHAVFGVADLRDKDEDEDYMVDIEKIVWHRNVLALLQLRNPLLLGRERLPANVSVAPICSHYEYTRLLFKSQLVASAWATSNSSDCALYEQPMRLMLSNACSSVRNADDERGTPPGRFCVAPIRAESGLANGATDTADNCTQCLGHVGSVLHMLRADGTRCVLGVASPAPADCDEQPMYYTSVLDDQFAQFMQQALQQTQQQQQP